MTFTPVPEFPSVATDGRPLPVRAGLDRPSPSRQIRLARPPTSECVYFPEQRA
ncbi:hypothetical protein Srut_54430 [Streptomyces rutgersensis]|nr:hypothetical protein Srut_54430 [Streptomyces rutgersensis]